jgi:hypothetical protein
VKKYFFGYLFVRIAKLLAILIVMAGLGFALLKYSQASVASASRAYQASDSLRRAVENLENVFSRTQQLVSSFNELNKSSTPRVNRPRFPAVLNSNSDFDRLDRALSSVDQERQHLKQSIVNRFETLTNDIEEKLRRHAAALQPTPSPARVISPPQSPTPPPAPAAVPDQISLFSSNITSEELAARNSQLTNGREFLKILETRAENTENKSRLAESAAQLDTLSKLLLLPQKEEPKWVPAAPLVPSEPEPQVGQVHQAVSAEKVAEQVQQLRESVKGAVTTSWALDDAFEEVFSLAKTEKQRCRAASLEQEGIWLTATGQIFTDVVAAVLVSFLILVFADLTQTLLDTATNTGVIAGGMQGPQR